MNVKDKRIFWTAFFITLLSSSALSAQATTGYINYLEGSVSVSRNGRYLAANKITPGLVLEEFDIVETGADGFVEIEIRSGNSSNGTIVRVKENTSYYFKVTKSGKKKNTVFQMLKGSVSFKVKKLTDEDSVDVYTSTTTMGVRGTQFAVNTMPDGSVLVTCDEGKVSCSSENKEVFAYPGQVAEKAPNYIITSIAVDPEDLDIYTKNWIDARTEALQINI